MKKIFIKLYVYLTLSILALIFIINKIKFFENYLLIFFISIFFITALKYVRYRNEISDKDYKILRNSIFYLFIISITLSLIEIDGIAGLLLFSSITVFVIFFFIKLINKRKMSLQRTYAQPAHASYLCTPPGVQQINGGWKNFLFDIISMFALSIAIFVFFAYSESFKWHWVGNVMHHLVKENEKGNKEFVNKILIMFDDKINEGKNRHRAFFEVGQYIQEYRLNNPTEEEIQRSSRFNLNSIKSSVKSLEKKYNMSIDNLIKEESKNLKLDINESIFYLIKNEEYYLFNKLFKFNDFSEYFDKNYRRDGWGTPLNLDYTTNLTGLSESLSNSLNKCSIAVWSSGPNKIDERCLGDDIPWPASRE
jgi:hypothetical protein